MNTDLLIREVQAKLGLLADGKAGPQTWAAIHRLIIGKKAEDSPANTALVDARSEGVIATLHPKVKDYARALVHAAAAQGITIKVISGLRTYAEQDALFKKGNVTKARGGYSNHNFALAFDVGVFKGATYIPESPAYKAVGSLGIGLGLEWGGNWKSFEDQPHFQLRPEWADGSERDMLAELRARKASGKDAFA